MKGVARLHWHCTHVLRALQAIIHVVDTVLLASKDSLNANAVDLSAPAPSAHAHARSTAGSKAWRGPCQAHVWIEEGLLSCKACPWSRLS